MVQMGDDFICSMDGAGTILIKTFDLMVRELKDVRYVPQIKENFISVGSFGGTGSKVF